MNHLKKWGAVYATFALFLLSWIAHGVSLSVAEDGFDAAKFWEGTFENWQSEFLQLGWQGIAFLALKHVWFKKDAEDMERIEAKLDTLLERRQ